MQNRASAGVIRLYYGFQVFFNLLLWLPIFYEYQRLMGLSDAQIFSIQSWYYLAFCFLEVPTGFVADRWGCRRSLSLAAVVLLAANLLPIVSAGYAGFLAHFCLIALGRSLESGASSAYLYDWLKSRGEASSYQAIEGRARAYELVGKLIGWAVVGVLMRYHPTLPYWLTALWALLAWIMVERLPEITPTASPGPSRPEGSSGPPRSALDGVAPVFGALAGSPRLILLMFQGLGLFALGHIAQVELYQPLLGSKGFDLVYYGGIMSAMTLVEAAGSAQAGWLRKFLSDLNSVFALTLAIALSFVVMALGGQAAVVFGLLAFAYAAGLAYPIQKQMLNDAIVDSRHRATLLSIESILDRAAYSALVPAMAVFVATGRVGHFLQLAAGGAVILMGFLFLLARRMAPTRAPGSELRMATEPAQACPSPT